MTVVLAQLHDPKAVLGIAVGIPLAVLLLVLVWLRPGRVALQAALTAVLVAGLAVGVAAVARTARWGGEQGITATLPPGVEVGPLPPQAATCRPDGTELHLVAQGLRFDTGCLAAPAGRPFRLSFDNRDSGVPHNLAIYTDQSASEALFQGEIVTGPASTTYRVEALAPGSYFFRCDVHPNLMLGTFVVAEG
ncbi:MAG TPA: cupredoxin domain-containing protein [Actinomycetota bacterium]|nr:cupredoxin domain-containing protein [Actinomycetota bacterium]